MARLNPASRPISGSLRSFVERIERLDEEIKGLNDDKRDLYAEAKGNGFDAKALRAVVSIRRKDSATVAEHNAIVQLYLDTLGMEVTLPEPSRVQVQARAREEIDPATGEITEIGDGGPVDPPASDPPPDAGPMKAGNPIHVLPGTHVNPHTGLRDLDDDAGLRRRA